VFHVAGYISATISQVALVILLLELRRLGIQIWESLFFLFWLVTATGENQPFDII
jgi:hypothetical protein